MSKSRVPETSANLDESAQKFSKSAALMDESLSLSTGLGELNRKLVTYWTLATHSLPSVDTFPALAMLGKMGTGKSQALKVVGNFAYRRVPLSLRGMTAATIRDTFAGAFEGTAVVEEADGAWNDKDGAFESMVSDRCQRSTANASHKVPSGDRKWESVSKPYFGATALHRRIAFIDPALDGRSIQVRTHPDNSRRYEEFSEDAPCNAEGRELIDTITFTPPTVEQPDNVAGRVFNSYRRLLATALICGDDLFATQVLPILQGQTAELKEAQSSEPDGLVLRAIVEEIFEGAMKNNIPTFKNIKLSALNDAIWRNHRVALQPRQIGGIARELGFETKPSHGVTVIVPTARALLRACDDCEYTDEDIEKLRAAMNQVNDKAPVPGNGSGR